MKKLFIAAAAVFMFASCSETIEDKAENIIESDMGKTLVKPDTYDALETKVDSAFAPMDDAAVINMMLRIAGENVSLSTIDSKISELKKNIENAHTNMMFLKKQKIDNSGEAYKKYKEYYDEYSKILKEIEAKKDIISERIEQEFKDVRNALNGDRKFIGYKVTHKYSAENNEGKQLEDSCMYLLDKEMKNVLFSFPLDKYRLIMQSIEMIGSQLESNDSIK